MSDLQAVATELSKLADAIEELLAEEIEKLRAALDRTYADHLAGLGEIEKLREAIIQGGHYATYPNPMETIDGHGEDIVECETCAEPWPCWAATALGESADE